MIYFGSIARNVSHEQIINVSTKINHSKVIECLLNPASLMGVKNRVPG